MKRIVLAFCTAVLLLAVDASAQTVNDGRVWGTITLQQHVSPNSPWRLVFESYIRSREGVSELDSFGLRPTIVYAIDSHSSVGGGYGIVESYPTTGGWLFENRPYGQYIWTGTEGGGTLTLRTRVEARFVPGNSSTVGRVRQQVRYMHVIQKGSRVSLLGYDEFFVNLNDTTKYARGIDQNRAFGGFSAAVTNGFRLEAGYLNQFVPGHGRTADKMNHVLASTFVITF